MPRSNIRESEIAKRVTDVQAAFSEVVRRSRLERSMSQEELAERSGLHRTYISDIERGTRNLAFSNLIRIADSLELPLSSLMHMIESDLNGNGKGRSNEKNAS